MEMFDTWMLLHSMLVTVPVVPEFVLMRAPFWEFFTTELVKRTSETSLFDLPPIEPIDRPCPPSHTMFETVMLLPDVTATQSSWLITVVEVMRRFVVLETSKPSLLCAAGSPPEAALGAFPAELSSVSPVIVVPEEPVISKQ